MSFFYYKKVIVLDKNIEKYLSKKLVRGNNVKLWVASKCIVDKSQMEYDIIKEFFLKKNVLENFRIIFFSQKQKKSNNQIFKFFSKTKRGLKNKNL